MVRYGVSLSGLRLIKSSREVLPRLCVTARAEGSKSFSRNPLNLGGGEGGKRKVKVKGKYESN